MNTPCTCFCQAHAYTRDNVMILNWSMSHPSYDPWCESNELFENHWSAREKNILPSSCWSLRCFCRKTFRQKLRHCNIWLKVPIDSDCPQCISIPNRYLICCSFNHWRYLLVFAVIGNSAATCQCHLVVFQINVLLQIGRKINKAVSESAAFDFWKRSHTNRDNVSQNL